MQREAGDPYKLDRATIAELAANFDHHDERLGGDPYPVYDAMREQGPLVWSENYGGFWVATEYETAHYIWGTHELFSSFTVILPGDMGANMKPLEVDPPLHARYRSPLTTTLLPKNVAGFEDSIRKECTRLIDAFIDNGECDIIAELAEPLATSSFLTLFGLPLDEQRDFIGWKNQIIHPATEDPFEDVIAGAGALRCRIADMLEERRNNPGSRDALTVLLAADGHGGPLSEEEILDVAQTYFLAGLDTVQASLGYQFWYLGTHPDHRDRLVREPEIIPAAVEEMLRWEGLITTRRTAREDVEVAGVAIKSGCPVIIPNRAAGHDPERFPNPEYVDFDRGESRHMAFGTGPHRCPGQHLARLELRIVHEEMHRRIPNYRLKEGAVIRTLARMSALIDAVPLVFRD